MHWRIPVRARAVGMVIPLQLSRPARQCAKAKKVPLEVADFFQAERIECTQSGCHSCAQLLPCEWRVPIEGTDNAALMLATLAALRESVRILRARLRSFCCRPRARAGVAAAAGAHHRALCRGRQRRCVGAPHSAAPERRLRAAIRGGEPRRRQRHHRCGSSRARAGRWLHLALGSPAAAGDPACAWQGALRLRSRILRR